MAAKYQALTPPPTPPRSARPGPGSRAGQRRAAGRPAPARAKARVACAASLLRWVCFMTVHDAGWDPAAASGGRFAPAWQAEAA